MKLHYWESEDSNEREEGISVREAKRLLKEKGGYAWTEWYQRDGTLVNSVAITLGRNPQSTRSSLSEQWLMPYKAVNTTLDLSKGSFISDAIDKIFSENSKAWNAFLEAEKRCFDAGDDLMPDMVDDIVDSVFGTYCYTLDSIHKDEICLFLYTRCMECPELGLCALTDRWILSSEIAKGSQHKEPENRKHIREILGTDVHKALKEKVQHVVGSDNAKVIMSQLWNDKEYVSYDRHKGTVIISDSEVKRLIRLVQ